MSDSSEPWYREGLHFTCTQCGDCCTGAPGYVWVNDAEIDAMAAHLGMPRQEFVQVHTRNTHRGRSLRERSNGDCVFFEKGTGCTIYSVRPMQCRTWPFWEGNLDSPKTWQRICDICPGSGEGEFVPVEEITRRMKAVSL